MEFTELFTSPYGGCMEKTGQVYWSNWCSTNMEYSFIWFEKQDNIWHAHSDVSMGGIRIKKDTPLPDATDKNITRCLELDPMIYLYHPDIENWIRRDRCGEVKLYHQIEEKDSTDEHHIIYTIDPRNGALYYYDGFPWNRAAPEEARPATYAELAQTDSRYTGMTIQNWEKYLPKKVNSDQNGRQFGGNAVKKIKKISDGELGTLRRKAYESDTDVDVYAFVNGLYETNFKPVKVRLIEGVEMDMQSVNGDEYLISTFLEEYEEIKTLGHDLMYQVYGYLGNDRVIITIADDYRIISTATENPDIELDDILPDIELEDMPKAHQNQTERQLPFL